MGDIGSGGMGQVPTPDGAGSWSWKPAVAGQSVFDLALGEDSQPITMQDMPMAIVLVATTIKVVSMVCWLAVAGAAGDVFMAIYDLAGDRLAVTVAGAATGSPGFLQLDLVTPLVLEQNDLVYFALYSDSSGSQYLRVTMRFNGAGIIIAPRPTSVGVSPPSSVTIDNGQTDRFWVAAAV